MQKYLITYNFDNENFKKEIFATSESEAIHRVISVKTGAIILSVKEASKAISFLI